MNNEVAEKLKELIKQHGTSLCDEPRRCRALLMDYCGEHKREVRLLVSATEANTHGELLSSVNIPYEILKPRLAKKLCDEFGLTEQAATWAVNAWAFALEVKEVSLSQMVTEDSIKNLIEQGEEYYNSGHYEKALRCCEAAVELDPQYARAWNNKGRSLSRLGRPEEALRCYDKALEIEPQYAVAWHNKGDVLSDLGRHEEELRCYDKALEVDPQYAHAWYNKGFRLYELGHNEEALRFFDRALEIDPHCVHKWTNKGNSLAKLGRHKEAQYCFNKAKEIDPTIFE